MAKTAKGIVDGGGTGVITARSASSIHNRWFSLACKATTPNTSVYQADATVTEVKAIPGSGSGAAFIGKPAHRLTQNHKPAHPPIHNHFARPRPGLPAPGAARSQTHH
jgi:hypothetical protein